MPSKYNISLEGVDIEKILKNHYRVTNVSSVDRDNENDELICYPYNGDETKFDNLYETNITSLLQESSKRYITFLDPHQSTVKMWASMYDIVNGGALPLTTDRPCWWCKETFITCPIGAPIRYHPHQTSGHRKEIIENNLRKDNFVTDTNDFFETDGIFCSFPCVKAHISDELKKGNIRYKDSATFLTQLYLKLYGKIVIIDKAPDWKNNIDKWGGHMPIDHYRSSFCRLSYTTTCNIKRPLMYSIGTYVEESHRNY